MGLTSLKNNILEGVQFSDEILIDDGYLIVF